CALLRRRAARTSCRSVSSPFRTPRSKPESDSGFFSWGLPIN
ncbi:MAG: hypothetical protein AVDCRST_MAG83-3091, partial [uncultured Arthrobacter sp.]